MPQHNSLHHDRMMKIRAEVLQLRWKRLTLRTLDAVNQSKCTSEWQVVEPGVPKDEDATSSKRNRQ
jgi:hypothetical protein